MSDLRYAPSEWLDEIMPDLVDDPSDLLVQRNGRWVLLAIDERQEAEPDAIIEIEPGQPIEFSALRDHADVTLTIHDDGGFTVSPPVASDANCFRLAGGDYDDHIFDTIKDLVEKDGVWSIALGDHERLKPGDYQLENWAWIVAGSYCLTIDEQGARMVSCAGVV